MSTSAKPAGAGYCFQLLLLFLTLNLTWLSPYTEQEFLAFSLCQNHLEDP